MTTATYIPQAAKTVMPLHYVVKFSDEYKSRHELWFRGTEYHYIIDDRSQTGQMILVSDDLNTPPLFVSFYARVELYPI